MVVSPKGLDEGWFVMVMVLVMVLVWVKCVGVGLVWFDLVRIGIDKMDEAMMKHFTYSPSLSPLI